MKWNEGPKFENPSPGNSLGRCIQIIDLGTQEHRNPKTGETWGQRDVRIVWELPTELMQGLYKPEVAGRPFAVGQNYNQSLAKTSKLRKILVSWRGRDFSDEEAKSFEPHSLLGIACTLSLVENEGYINVHSVAGVMRGMAVPKQINPSIFLSLEPEEFDETVFFALPDKTREKIAGSPEFKRLLAERPHLAQSTPAPQGHFTPDPRQTPPPNTFQQAQQHAPQPQRPVVPRPPALTQQGHQPTTPAHLASRQPAQRPLAHQAPVEDDVPWPTTDGEM